MGEGGVKDPVYKATPVTVVVSVYLRQCPGRGCFLRLEGLCTIPPPPV